MNLVNRARRAVGHLGGVHRRAGVVLPLALAFLLLIGSVAYGAVWPDQDDYTPGSVVTISGDNSNGAGYLAGETVTVDVFGPNGFMASCDGVADEAGAWTCQITLWADERAIGDYTFTATGATSGVSEDGAFADNHQPAHNVRFATSGLPSGIGFSLSVNRANNGSGHTVQTINHSFTSPGPSATAIATAPGTEFTYSGFPTTLNPTGRVCSLTGTSPASPFTTGSAAGSTTVTAMYNCVAANTAPTTPGVPFLASGSNPNSTGVFTLSWTASTDAQNDTITYNLEHKDADDAGYSNVASGLATNSHSFTGSGEAEGTWTYRAQASDGSLTSAFSGASSQIVVDKTAPNAPILAPDRPPDYAGGGGWYLNTVTVSTNDAGDPSLLDGSAGSGVAAASVAGDAAFNTSGSHVVTETVFDNAGNQSAAASLTVQVDATDPIVSISCPAGSVVQGSSTSANWTASDAHSGLAPLSLASGSVSLNTSSIGTHTANAPTATDNVGRTAGASCTYTVVYNWTGFFRPVDNLPVINAAKAGSAIPVKFSLGGNQGLNIFSMEAPYNGSPVSQPINCDTNAPIDSIEETVTAGGSSLSYDAVADQYTYVWKTNKGWANSCRHLTLKLADGTTRVAHFKFTR